MFLACGRISAQHPSANPIDELIKEASQQLPQGDWKELEGFETWKIERFVEMTRFLSNADHYDFQITHGEEFSIIVESDGRWPVTDLESLGNRFYLEFEGKRCPFLPQSVEEKSVVAVLRSTPNIPRFKKSRRYIHVKGLLDAFVAQEGHARQTRLPAHPPKEVRGRKLSRNVAWTLLA